MEYSLNCGSETDPFTIWHFWDFSRFEFHVSCKCSCTGRAWCRSENPFNFQKIVKLQKLLHDESHIAVSKYDFLLFGQKVVLHLEFKPTSPQLNDWSSSSESSSPSSWPLVIITIQMNQPRVCWVTSWVTYPGSNRSRFMRGGPKQVKYFPNFFSSVILSPSIKAICRARASVRTASRLAKQNALWISSGCRGGDQASDGHPSSWKAQVGFKW